MFEPRYLQKFVRYPQNKQIHGYICVQVTEKEYIATTDICNNTKLVKYRQSDVKQIWKIFNTNSI